MPPTIFRLSFQAPYALSPLFATLTKTAGVWGIFLHPEAQGPVLVYPHLR